MRRVVQLAVILLLVLILSGLLITGLGQVRQAERQVRCRNNLWGIGVALSEHHATFGYFPPGTVPNPDLPPDRRLSWLVPLWPTFMCGGYSNLLDRSQAWDAKENCPPRCRHRIDSEGHYQEEPWGDLKVFLCPANATRSEPGLPGPTHYQGIAGVGQDAAELPLSDPRAGFFGYDRQVTAEDIKDGLSTTLAVAEVVEGGPWTAGGRATVRGLRTDDRAYLGEGGQFASYHRSTHGSAWSPPVVTNVLFADGQVRPLTAAVSAQVFEALATIAGGEAVSDPGSE